MDAAEVAQERSAWEAIAGSFDRTRRRPWAPVVEYLASLRRGERLLDVGAGNGRHAEAARRLGLDVTAVDLSRRLLAHARRRAGGILALEGVAQRLPLRTASHGAALAAASVHHVRGRAHRVEAWREVARVVRAEGLVLATAWSRNQPRFSGPPAASRESPPEGLQPGDLRLPWRADGLDVPRFIHLYEEGELEAELSEAGWEVLEVSWPALGGPVPDNHVVRARRRAATQGL